MRAISSGEINGLEFPIADEVLSSQCILKINFFNYLNNRGQLLRIISPLCRVALTSVLFKTKCRRISALQNSINSERKNLKATNNQAQLSNNPKQLHKNDATAFPHKL